MSYAEILIAVVIIGLVSTSIALGVSNNNKGTEDANRLITAIEIAKNEVKGDILGEIQTIEDGYIVEKDTTTYNELVQVKVKWTIAEEEREYIIYATKPDSLYNN